MKFLAIGKKWVLFFAISHMASYIISTLQSIWIVSEIRKAQEQAEKAAKKPRTKTVKQNDPN